MRCHAALFCLISISSRFIRARFTHTIRSSTIVEFMSFTSQVSPIHNVINPIGWWDGEYTKRQQRQQREVSIYDFGYPLSPTVTVKGKGVVKLSLLEKSQ